MTCNIMARVIAYILWHQQDSLLPTTCSTSLMFLLLIKKRKDSKEEWWLKIPALDRLWKKDGEGNRNNRGWRGGVFANHLDSVSDKKPFSSHHITQPVPSLCSPLPHVYTYLEFISPYNLQGFTALVRSLCGSGKAKWQHSKKARTIRQSTLNLQKKIYV